MDLIDGKEGKLQDKGSGGGSWQEGQSSEPCRQFSGLFFFFIKRDEKLWQDSELRCSRICLKRVILAAVKEVDWEQGGQTRIREEISSLGWKIAAGEHEGRLGLKCFRAERDWVCMRVGNGT